MTAALMSAGLLTEIAGQPIPDLARKFGTPVYVYDAAKIVERQEEPTPPALAAQLNRDFIAQGLLDYTAADWNDKLKKAYTDPLTALGGQQDEMVGECRWVVKALRQKAGILMATDPNMAPIAAEIRARTQKMLRGGAAYEGARH